MKQGWKKFLLYSGIALCILAFIVGGYFVPIFGFGDYVSPSGEFERGKTIWDWMELLIIPAVLAGGAILLNRSDRALERKTVEDRAKLERGLATDRQQEAALQTYFDRMSELLLKDKLKTTKKAEVRDIARTRTLSVMRNLNTRRNNLVIQFLSDAKLITEKNSILIKANMDSMNLQELNLNGSDLRGADLQGANLKGANLQGTKLEGANLVRANLQGANLRGADLRGADFTGAYLAQAILRDANLMHADLKGAKLGPLILSEDSVLPIWRGADLAGANLKGAKNTTEKQLAEASLQGAIMPNGTKHE